MPARRSFGECIRRRLSRLLSPEISFTLDLATPKVLARYLIKWLLALPSTGGAVMRILRTWFTNPTISLWLARVLFQGDKSGFSVYVVFRSQAPCAGNGYSPCQVRQRRCGTSRERPKGWPVSVHGRVPPLAKDYSHSLRGAPCPEH